MRSYSIKALSEEPSRKWGQFTMLVLLAFNLVSCQKHQNDPEWSKTDVQIARLGEGDKSIFNKIKLEFEHRNPGYEIDYLDNIVRVDPANSKRVLFVQQGQPEVVLSDGVKSEVTIGDVLLLEPGIGLKANSALSLLQFKVPEPFPDSIPKFIRPDWDPNITDIPGGCATETNAYRRILLTWKKEVGKYLYHALNAHRVRIMDSFSHYHPEEGGFDEFYLVQMALPEAKIFTSNKITSIITPNEISPVQAEDLVKSTSLQVGDLVYLPRGVMHRGFGGVLAQVITVPGFIPGSEVGVDHHLKAINERLNLVGEKMLPFNEGASINAVVK